MPAKYATDMFLSLDNLSTIHFVGRVASDDKRKFMEENNIRNVVIEKQITSSMDEFDCKYNSCLDLFLDDEIFFKFKKYCEDNSL